MILPFNKCIILIKEMTGIINLTRIKKEGNLMFYHNVKILVDSIF